MVALDGVVGDSLRGAMLDEVTQPGWAHDTAAAPPTPKWERATNDGAARRIMPATRFTTLFNPRFLSRVHAKV